MANGKKTGGRQKGSLNKITRSIREPLKLFLERKWPDMEKKFDKLPAKDQWYLYEKLMAYCIPKYQHVSMNLNQMSEQDLEFLLDHLKQNINDETSDTD